LLGGLLSAGLTASVYFFEDAFQRLPIHWMWWPAIGGLCIGVGGLFFPQALGVGYSTIGAVLQSNVALRVLIGVLVVKWLIWSIALGSGTSGGVLAPLLMIGGALGGLETMVFPNYGLGFWTMVSMAATLGGTMRSPFTAILFSLELTHEFNMLFPLMIAVFVSYGLTVLTMKRSILTEKVSRRGFHLTREYAIDPLETMFVREVMRERRLKDLTDRTRLTAFPDEPLRVVVYRMAEHGATRLPVVSREDPTKVLGLVSLRDLLRARTRDLKEERHRERTLRVRHLLRGKRVR
jgi:CBS domain-containing protein